MALTLIDICPWVEAGDLEMEALRLRVPCSECGDTVWMGRGRLHHAVAVCPHCAERAGMDSTLDTYVALDRERQKHWTF